MARCVHITTITGAPEAMCDLFLSGDCTESCFHAKRHPFLASKDGGACDTECQKDENWKDVAKLNECN